MPPPPTTHVRALSPRDTRGWIEIGGLRMACALGRGGLSVDKREGDGKTPIGCWPVRYLFYRPDRLRPPTTALPCLALSPDDGWCDDPGDRNYNRHVSLPYPARCEQLWRPDHIYDIIVVLGHNDAPPVRGRGSAIFMHLARPGYAPTEGCIALPLADLRRLVAQLRPGSLVRVL